MSAKSISTDIITSKIFIIRGQKVILDRDLALMYAVPTKRLLEQVKRNRKRFPADFMFRLTKRETANLRPQIATSSWGGQRYLHYAFTEQGVAMLSSVLRSDRAVLVNVAIMRTFVKLRETLSLHKELADKLRELEGKVAGNSAAIRSIFEAIRKLMADEEKPKKRIGFHP